MMSLIFFHFETKLLLFGILTSWLWWLDNTFDFRVLQNYHNSHLSRINDKTLIRILKIILCVGFLIYWDFFLFVFFCFCFCSAGVGRTGCFIVIDAMLERIKHEKTVDIYGHVTLMRAQRNYMVQTEDQYIFIHDALLEAVTCGNTEVPARNLYAYIQKLTQIETGENVTGMELEFKVWYWMWCGNLGASHSGIVFE